MVGLLDGVSARVFGLPRRRVDDELLWFELCWICDRVSTAFGSTDELQTGGKGLNFFSSGTIVHPDLLPAVP